MNNQQVIQNSNVLQACIHFIGNIFKAVLKFWYVCVIAFCIGIGCGILWYTASYVPQYTASTTFTIYTSNRNSQSGITTSTYSYDSSMAENIKSTFASVMQSDLLDTYVCEELGISYIPVSLSSSNVEGTNFYTLTAKGSDPDFLCKVLDAVLNQFKRIASHKIGALEINIMSAPEKPTAPVNKTAMQRKIFVFGLYGFGIGVVVLCFYTFFRKTVLTRGDIRSLLNSTCLEVIPKVSFRKYKRKIDKEVLLTNALMSDTVKSAFHSLRNAVMRFCDTESTVLLISSVAANEGKTTVAANLAISIAQMHKRVLLVDGDAKNHKAANLLKIDRKSDSTFKGTLFDIKESAQNGISVLVFHEENTGSVKYLKAEYLKRLFEQLREKYDFILIDAPSVEGKADFIVFSQVADASVCVVKQDTLQVSHILSGLEVFTSATIPLLGCVMNAAESVSQWNGYGYYGYAGRYGHYRYGGYHRQDADTTQNTPL